jgi:hypothetical protein
MSHAPDFIDLDDSREELKAKDSRQHHTQLLDNERYRDGTGWQGSTLFKIEQHLNSQVRRCVCSTGQTRAGAICHRCEKGETNGPVVVGPVSQRGEGKDVRYFCGTPSHRG